MGDKKTPQRVSKTGIDGSTPAVSGSGTSDIASCHNPTSPSVCIWNGSIGNIRQTTTPNSRETSEFHTSFDRIFSNYYNAPSIGRHILHDELYVSSRRDIYFCCGTNVAAKIVQPMVSQLVSHGLPTIDTLNENAAIWIPYTSSIRRNLNTTHGSASGNAVWKGTVVGSGTGDYREGNYKTDYEIAHKNSKLQSKHENVELS